MATPCKLIVRILLLTICLRMLAPAAAQGLQSEGLQGGPRSVTADLESEISDLVKQLASNTFQARENATLKLLGIGQPALAKLQSIGSAELEVQLRVDRVVNRIQSNQFEVLSRSFLLDPDPKNAYGFPAWDSFSERVGHSRTSKLLFLDIIRLQPGLIDLVERISSSDAPKPSDFAELELLAATNSTILLNNRLHMQVPEIGDFAAILFAASFMQERTPVEVNDLLGSGAGHIPVTTHMRRPGYGVALRRLYSAWIPKTHASMGMRAIGISLQYGLETGAIVARKNLDANLDVRTREQAIYCLARFGDMTDIGRLAPLLDDQSIVVEFSGIQLPLSALGRIEESSESPPGSSQKAERPTALDVGSLVRVNDLALAAICMLAEEEPESVFPGFVRNELFGFDCRSIAVAKVPEAQAERRKLIRQWKKRFSPAAG